MEECPSKGEDRSQGGEGDNNEDRRERRRDSKQLAKSVDEKKKKRKRKRSRSSSSSSSSSSASTSSNTSSYSSDYKCKPKRKSKKKRRKSGSKQDRKLIMDLIKTVTSLQKQIIPKETSVSGNDVATRPRSQSICDCDDQIDLDASGELFEDVSGGNEANTHESNQDIPVMEPELNLTVGTKIKEPAIPHTPNEMLKQLFELQLFDQEDWNNVRYADVQKSCLHNPGFTSLEPNEEVKRYDNSKFSANMEKAFAEKAGGVNKAFWPKIKDRKPALQNDPHSSRGPQKPSTSKGYPKNNFPAPQKKPGTFNNSSRGRNGQLHVYVDQWEYLGAPPHILKMVTGYRIPFKQKPPLHTPNFQHQTNVSPEMSKIIKKLVLEGVLEEARVTPSFISTIFLRPKSDGTSRPIFNLKRLNNFVHAGKFRLVNVQRVPDFIQENDWMAKIDLRQAYFHLPVAQAHRRFLRLIYANKLWQITCLPFGLSSAPKAFACLTNWIAQCLRNRGVRILVYLDDFFLVNQDAATLQKHIVVTISLLRSLGWEINTEKSVLTPRKALEFLGLIWDPWQNLKYLPDRLTTKIESLSANLLAKKKTTLLDLQKIIGMMNFACFVVKRGRLHYRALQALSNKMLACPRIKTLPLPAQVILELIWWQRNCRTHSQLHIPAPRHYLTTDASDLGWGAILDNQKLQGCWTHSQQRLHCNQKEMLAILNVLNLRGKSLASKGLLIQSDNSSVIAYLRNEGGTKSVALTKLTKKVYQILDLYNIRISVYHIPGSYNCYADRLSRRQITPEWHLLPPLTQIVFKKWGTPTVDLFASRDAHVVQTYCTLDRTDKQATYYDALGMEWNFHLAWLFPPPHLIPRVLAHLNKAIGSYLIIVPRWEGAYWRPDLKSRAQDAPFTIKNLSQVLIDTTTGLPPPKVSEMNLEIWKCGGGANS
ncbi:uncharacterized protein LOC123722104 [Papilio machaon]|uniref:uncharacterized protein LOC123722104 n=1 Tax=Papilio machaon TaxID=76193 RepID=UPI001E664E39|nr:uncharacterized protein LOC123722104 [Papilio machaon]